MEPLSMDFGHKLEALYRCGSYVYGYALEELC